MPSLYAATASAAPAAPVRGRWARLGWLSAGVLVALMMVQEASAQSRVIRNPSFEHDRLGAQLVRGTSWNGQARFVSDSRCPNGLAPHCMDAWLTTHSLRTLQGTTPANQQGYVIEIFGGGSSYAPSAANGQIAVELNAEFASRLYQNVCLDANEPIALTYQFAPRNVGGTTNQRVRAGIWPVGSGFPADIATGSTAALSQSRNWTNHGGTGRGPAGNGWWPQSATITAPPVTGVYQLGFEADLYTAVNEGNLLDDIRITLPPLVDLGGSPSGAVVMEGDDGPSLRVRINGQVRAGGVSIVLRSSGTAQPGIDYVLGTPTGLPSTTPTLTRNGDLWTLWVPPGEYDAGLSPAANASGISIPFTALANTNFDDDGRTVQFELLTQPGGNPGWRRADPVCSGLTPLYEGSYLINDATQAIELRGHVYFDANTNNQRDPLESWSSVTPVTSLVYVNVVRNNQVVSSISVPSGSGAWSLPLPLAGGYTVVVSNSPTNPAPAPPPYWQFQNPGVPAGTTPGLLGPLDSSGWQDGQVIGALDFGLKPNPVIGVSKSFADPVIALTQTTILRFLLNNAAGFPATPANGRITFDDLLPAGLSVVAPVASPQCGGTVTTQLEGGRYRVRVSEARFSAGTASCSIQFTVRGDTVGAKVNGMANFTSYTANLIPNIHAELFVGEFYDVEGRVYHDLDADGSRSPGEGATGVGWWVKLAPRTGAICEAPAVQVVPVDGNGRYRFINVPNGNWCVIVDDNPATGDVIATTPGWLPTEPADGRLAIVVAGAGLVDRDLGLFQGYRVEGWVFEDNGAGGGTPHDGQINGEEVGLAGVTVEARAGAAVRGTTVTDADGRYRLMLPWEGDAGIEIVAQTPGGYRSISESSGNTGAVIDDVTDDRISFAPVSAGQYTEVNFGDVRQPTFVPDQLRHASPGSIVFLPHVFTANSHGSVGFAIGGTTATPNIPDWAATLYHDENCDGVFDDGEPLLTGPLPVNVDTAPQVCVLVRVFVPAGAPANAQWQGVVSAELQYTGTAVTRTRTVTDLVTVGSGEALVLVKAVDQNSAQPGDTLTYTVTYRNAGQMAVSEVVIHDSTPAYTVYVDGSAMCPPPLPQAITACSAVVQPLGGATGPVEWRLIGDLLPGAEGRVRYQVTVED